ncbi:glycoside hydrolase family 3 protein [Salinactinospora qingdaonensis]|uniref:Glycoside hydrolase family 3 protein n=1 Tax=Salinactinospora qingdaonensis TaxID=702744 RepID=A0ABP7G895_9ACTN
MPTDRTLERLANATLLVPFEDLSAPRWALDGLADGFAGVCLFANNIADREQLRTLTRQLESAAEAPLISLDEEGGDVTRIGHLTGSDYPGNAALGSVDDPALTRAVHRALGAELHGLGITLDLAPSVDVNTTADNPVIGTRSFGADPELVSRHAGAAVTGLQEGGVAACAKHFPGHGATYQDSHEETPVIDADVDLLRRRELSPFRAAVQAGVRSVLTAHIRLRPLGMAEPATLTPAIVTDLLRTELGFDGMIISDALEMRGVSGDIGIPEAAVRALLAGCDLLCLGRFVYHDEIVAVREAIVTAVRSGRLDGQRLEQAAQRTALVRSWTTQRRTTTEDPAIGLDGARRAVQVTGELPSLHSPLVVELDAPPGAAVGEVPWGLAPWFPETVRLSAERERSDKVLADASGRPLVVVVRDAHRYPATRGFVTELCRARPDTVVVELGLPAWRPECGVYVSTHGASRASCQSAAEILGAAGTVPIS